MTPGPWILGRLMGGFAVRDGKFNIIAELRGSRMTYQEHKRNAELVAALPDLVEVLVAAESFFGDLPSTDKAALRLHGRITRVLGEAGIQLDTDAA